jgi:hypothetical protein
MSGLFDLLGVCLVLYTAYAVATGSVYARRGPWGRSYHRDEEPGRFWTIVVTYVVLSVALVFYF